MENQIKNKTKQKMDMREADHINEKWQLKLFIYCIKYLCLFAFVFI